MPAVTQVDVLPTGLRKQAPELCVREGAGERDRATGNPGREHEQAAVERPRDDVGIDEDAGADDAADHDHRGVERPERAAEGHAPHYTSSDAGSRRSLEAASGGLR